MSHPSNPSEVSPSQLEYWRRALSAHARQRQEMERVAWEEVRRIAGVLRDQFGATRVIVFGSLVRGRFTERSDLDIAVEGLDADRFFAALAMANGLTDRTVDLKPLESLSQHFRERVLATGCEVDATD
ncbi:nucleotidyltransferase family protein [Methylotetracoccus oryzae]|uniref:nucleotidyltransferase family protein n=1 Tax=Methylotetracoccus oryzae TaxID=1919059 RepID=UPI0011187F82|nr:nucleotidyltransferase domain-containing protein [Methylotetracoccus oryzae]